MPANRPEDRALVATVAAHEKWAQTEDRTAATAAARKTFKDQFVTQARERFGDLPEDELARRAEHLRKAHFTRLALKSAQARRAKKGGSPPGSARQGRPSPGQIGRIAPDEADGAGGSDAT